MTDEQKEIIRDLKRSKPHGRDTLSRNIRLLIDECIDEVEHEIKRFKVAEWLSVNAKE